jgi:hypothetical protein
MKGRYLMSKKKKEKGKETKKDTNNVTLAKYNCIAYSCARYPSSSYSTSSLRKEN